MATFTDIYKQELKSKGILSSIGGAAFKRTLETVDPRNILFGGKGIVSATGQKIFGKGYSGLSKTPTSSKISDSSSLTSEALSQLLLSSKNQEAQLSIIAKNTMNMNAMARDMNVTRQNMMKLVTINGGKAARGADMFFKNAAAREADYESKFKKATAPVPVTEKKTEEKKGGLFGIGTAIISAIVGSLKSIPDIIGKVLTSVFTVDNLSKILGFSGSVLGELGSFLIKVSPFLLRLVPILGAIAGAAWLLKWLSDKNQQANTPEAIEKATADYSGSDAAKFATENLPQKDAQDYLKNLKSEEDFIAETGYTKNELQKELEKAQEEKRPVKRLALRDRQNALRKYKGEDTSGTSPQRITALGSVSGKYESGKSGVDTISNAMGGKDPGGVSYGKYQLSSTKGTMKDFLNSPEGKPFSDFFKGLTPGSKEFNEMYKKIASEQREAFEKAQHDYIVRTHFNPVLSAARKMGFNTEDVGVREALFSQSVQHGKQGNLRILKDAMKSLGPNSTAEDQVKKLYEARGGYVSEQKIDEKIKLNVLKRYQNESADVLALTGKSSTTGTALAAGSSTSTQLKNEMATAPTTTVVPVPTATPTKTVMQQTTKIESAYNESSTELFLERVT